MILLPDYQIKPFMGSYIKKEKPEEIHFNKLL